MRGDMRSILVAALLILLQPSLALSQTACGEAEKIKINMALQGNKPWFRGLSARGHITEIWVHKTSYEFIAFVVYPNATLCVVDAGSFAETTSLLEASKEEKK